MSIQLKIAWIKIFLGHISGIDTHISKYASVLIFLVFIALVILGLSIGGYITYSSGKLNDLINKLNDDVKKNNKSVGTIENYIVSDGTIDVKIGIFENLLLYAPIFIAEHLHFFRDESLSVKFEKVGGDREIAEGVLNGRFDFGICDPVFCLDGLKRSGDAHSSSTLTASSTPLKILMPIAKHISVVVVAKRGLNDLRKGTAITKRCIKILSYSPPSTSYTIAFVLKEWLAKQLHVNLEYIHIEKADPRETLFNDRCTLLEKLTTEYGDGSDTIDMALLFQPQLSWLMENGAARNKFGVLTRLTKSNGAQSDEWDIKPFEEIFGSNDRGCAGKDWAPYSPYNDRQKSHRAMISALLVSKETLASNPEACRRLYRAISRALLLLHATDWQEETQRSKSNIWKALGLQLGEVHVTDQESLKMMVRHHSGVFPYIRCLEDCEPEAYLEHFQNIMLLWYGQSNAPVMGPDFTGLTQFNVPPKELFIPYFVSNRELISKGAVR